jgi:hypothetical protein
MAIVKEVKTVLSFERDGDNKLPCALVLDHFVEQLDMMRNSECGAAFNSLANEIRGYMKALFFADVINGTEHSELFQLYSDAQSEWYRNH